MRENEVTDFGRALCTFLPREGVEPTNKPGRTSASPWRVVASHPLFGKPYWRNQASFRRLAKICTPFCQEIWAHDLQQDLQREQKNLQVCGIISVKCKPGCQTKLLFTPNSEHSVSDGTKIYAVFLPTCKCKCTQGVATPICGSLKSVPITVCDCAKLPELVAAATQQTAVEVEVPEKDGKPGLDFEEHHHSRPLQEEMRSGSRTVLFWGAGATASSGFRTTERQGKFLRAHRTPS